MEFLGRESADVASVSCSLTSSTAFATLTGQGTLTLWDLRLKRKNYLSLPNPNVEVKAEAMELCYFQDRHAAVALCGNTVQLYDTRKALSLVAEYVHEKECANIFRCAMPSCAETTLIVDEDGGMFPLNLTNGTRCSHLEAYVLGKPYTLPEKANTLGHLDSYCSGVHIVDVASEAGKESKEEVSRVLVAIGMDGKGAMYAGADGKNTNRSNRDNSAVTRTPFCIMESPLARQKMQLVNPPLVNCTAVHGTMLAAGRADGTYTIYSVKRDGPEALLEAPGHAVNGLCYVDWFSSDVLLTTSICGQVTGWNVGAFLAAEQEEEEDGEEGDLPEVVTAFDHREVAGCQIGIMNCGDRLGDSCYVFGDHMGGVTLARVEL